MHMLYSSESFVVVQFELPCAVGEPAEARGGFEIVDKFARKEIFLEGALADRFQRGVQALVAESPQGVNVEVLDDYIAGFTELAQMPLTLH
jgi:hypothetical protein